MAKLTAKLPFKLGGPVNEANVFRLRLLATRSPEAYVEDLEYNLRGVTQILGGNAYENGAPVSYPGSVSIGDNLRPGTKIGLERRVEKYGYAAIQVTFPTPDTDICYDMKQYIPVASCLGEHVPVHCQVGFRAWHGAVSSGNATGTFRLQTTKGSYLVTPDTALTLAPGVVATVPVGGVGPGAGLATDDYILCQFERNDSQFSSVLAGLQVTLVVKALHTA